MKINSYINTGNSIPVILEDNGQKYFVKLKAGMSGANSMINEWIGNTLGNQLKINTQIPKWITIPRDIEITDVNIEVKELIRKSIGMNIGFEYQEKAMAIQQNDLAELDEKKLEEIFLLDILLINIDRTANNTNFMKVAEQIYSVDYESSLLFQDSIGNGNLLGQESILQCLRNSPLYKEIELANINAFIEKVDNISGDELIAEIPESILSKEKRAAFLKGMAERKSNNWYLTEVIERLKAMNSETKEELKLRANNNQAMFKANLSRNK